MEVIYAQINVELYKIREGSEFCLDLRFDLMVLDLGFGLNVINWTRSVKTSTFSCSILNFLVVEMVKCRFRSRSRIAM